MERRSVLHHDDEVRAAAWRRLVEILEAHAAGVVADDAPIVPSMTPEAIAAALADLDFDAPREPVAVVEAVARGLELGTVHTDHPRYFGLFNPAAATLAVIGDALASGFNSQLATRDHAPFPVAAEEHVIAELGARFGWDRANAFGAFTSGGGEANATALQCALAHAFPGVAEHGVRSLSGEPRVYVSGEGHATIGRAARLAGLGAHAVRIVPADGAQRMKSAALREAIARDRAEGGLPFLVVATAGTTSTGAIDPLPEIATIAERERCWLHVDAAWGGLAALVPELRPSIVGIERADSITFDAHKIMSAPMGTGTFLTRHDEILERVFADRTGYMPRRATRNPYSRSMQWSRRFLGARVLLPLAAVGWEGYATSLRRQVALARRLRDALAAGGWTIVGDTPLPIVCFVEGAEGAPSGEGAAGGDRGKRPAQRLDAIARATIGAGAGWISVPRLASGQRVLRACVNNHRTEEADIDRLVAALDAARRAPAEGADGDGD
ncbi:MAG: aminotransferase class V-fold PLP-dependent enzyme [Deltaproteobacteria bacterium]|nr:aminotransferase class V-fold PLP-dependent enzyme [Deltaproteobacteria bacterium]